MFSLDACFAQLYCGQLLPPRARSMVLRCLGPKSCASQDGFRVQASGPLSGGLSAAGRQTCRTADAVMILLR
jgi:hypothetical protein